jgi:hypothetical protein
MVLYSADAFPLTRKYQEAQSQKLLYGVLGMGSFPITYVEIAAVCLACLTSVPRALEKIHPTACREES